MSAAAARIEGPPAGEIQPFLNGAEYLLAELERLRYIVHAEVRRMRAAKLLTDNQFRGLYVSDEQVDAILLTASGEEGGSRTASSGLRSLGLQAAEYAERIAAQCAVTAVAGLVLPLQRLSLLYSLSELERDALLLSVAPEIDASFETLYSYAQNDVTRKRPTVGLILRLLGFSPAERLELRKLFSATGALLQAPLLRFSDETRETDVPFLSRAVRPEECIVDFLLGSPQLDSRLRPFTHCVECTRPLRSLHFPDVLTEGLHHAARALREPGGILFFHGDAGAGKRAAAEALSAEAGRGLVVADIRQAKAAGASPAATLALLYREAQLRAANLLLAHAEVWIAEENTQRYQSRAIFESLSQSIAGSGVVLFVTSESPWPVAESGLHCAWSGFKFPTPGFLDRTRLWQEALASIGASLPPETASLLANRFVLTGGQIHSACLAAGTHALLRGQDASTLAKIDFEAEARSQSNQGLLRRAQKVESSYDWRDLVVPARVVQQLREVCAAEKYRSVIYVEWGFDRRMVQGRGLNVLFTGPSGTGKTMSAGIVARELGLDLYKIDLSTVVSKYIGETEKQLSQIFREAQSSNAILFFDEADAIFGKRSEVKDAHDRYANVEVAYLLQKMEEYEGIVILATNFRKNIDDAFTRRIHYIIEFPFPEGMYREHIWRSMMPAGAPLAEDVDFGFLGRQFELAGGNIRNAVLLAALYAAEEGGAMRMEHFVLAVARELQKMGKLPSRSEFREYYELTRERV
jgi:ATP-dependent 26S proteasome regulatory subunit